MKKLTLITLCALLVLAATAPAVSAGTLLISESIFKANKHLEKQPAEVVAGLLVPERLVDADVCVYYTNTTNKGNQGLIRTKVTILDRSGDVDRTQTMTLNGRVKNNEAIICKKAPNLQPGDGADLRNLAPDHAAVEKIRRQHRHRADLRRGEQGPDAGRPRAGTGADSRARHLPDANSDSDAHTDADADDAHTDAHTNADADADAKQRPLGRRPGRRRQSAQGEPTGSTLAIQGGGTWKMVGDRT